MLEHGAAPNNVWTTGHTLLNLISDSSDPDLLKLALKYGANPNLIAPRLDETPLFAAVKFPEGSVNIPILIKAGADLNYQEKPSMETAAMDAAELGQFDIVYELLGAGANYKLKDVRGAGLRDSIRFSYWVAMGAEQQHWRDRVIEFMKQHNAWSDGSGGKDDAGGGVPFDSTISSQVQARGSSTAPLITNQVLEAKRKRFMAGMTAAVNNPQRLMELCGQTRKSARRPIIRATWSNTGCRRSRARKTQTASFPASTPRQRGRNP